MTAMTSPSPTQRKGGHVAVVQAGGSLAGNESIDARSTGSGAGRRRLPGNSLANRYPPAARQISQ